MVYAASQRGFFRSVDGGATWTASNTGLGVNPFVSALAVDHATGVLYADVSRASEPSGANQVFVSANTGATWTPTTLVIPRRTVTALTVVRERRAFASPGPRRSEQLSGDATEAPVSTVFLAARQVFSDGPFGVLFSSSDRGRTWTSIGEGLPPPGADALAVAPARSAIVYAGSRGVLFVSRDGGATFEPVAGMPTFGSIASIGVESADASTVYVATAPRSDAFVAKIPPGGGALDYSTYLGGAADDRASGVIVDDLGRAVVFGTTESIDLPAVAAVQDPRGGTDGFVSVVDGGGSVLLFSTRLGGNGTDSVVSAVPFERRLLDLRRFERSRHDVSRRRRGRRRRLRRTAGAAVRRRVRARLLRQQKALEIVEPATDACRALANFIVERLEFEHLDRVTNALDAARDLFIVSGAARAVGRDAPDHRPPGRRRCHLVTNLFQPDPVSREPLRRR